MTEKVKVTQKQFEWLEKYKTDEEINYAINIQPYSKRSDSPIVNWEPSRVARALYIGYEVEPEFKVGDWVVMEYKTVRVIGKITEIETEEFIAAKVDDPKYPVPQRIAVSKLRHATPSEIAEEKERRWWKKHGREPWELRKGDCLISKSDKHSCNVKFVEDCDDEGFLLVDGIKDEYILTVEELANKYQIFCFAKDRKDVQE